MKRIIFLVRSLDRGGAERQLVALASAFVQHGHQTTVAVFYGGGVFEADLRAAGVRVVSLGKGGRWDVLPFFIRLVRWLRNERPTVLHSYLTVSNLLAILLKPLLPVTHIVWGLRASNMDLSRYDWLSRLTDWVEKLLSPYPALIIANSHAGKRHAVLREFPEAKIVVIPNGIDTAQFAPDPGGRRRVRAEWGIKEDEVLVGLPARLDPMKDHPTFLRAAAEAANHVPNVRFVCVGYGSPDYQQSLQTLARELGLTDRIIWAGARDDMPAVYNALDVASSSSSFGEGFSNTIAEAMACGVPCVVTDVGDSAWIVEGTGVVVPPGDYKALAQGLLRLLTLPPQERRALGEASRLRVVTQFSIDKLVLSTEQALGLV